MLQPSDRYELVNFDASLLVMQFYCQLEIRYHVIRAEAEHVMDV